MAESALTISFGEPAAIGGGRIPVRALSPALLALGELVADASVLIDPDRDPAMLCINQIETGSSTVHLVVWVPGEMSRLTDLLSTDPATALLDPRRRDRNPRAAAARPPRPGRGDGRPAVRRRRRPGAR